MLIKCTRCNINSEVIEVQELENITDFSERLLVLGFCKTCRNRIAALIERRNSDNKIFVDSFWGDKAINVIKREKKRIKNKTLKHKYNGFVYGKNKEIRNKKGDVTQIRQYASDYSTGKQTLVKTLVLLNN